MKNKLVLTSLITISGVYAILILFLLIVFNLLNIPISYLLIVSVIVLVLQFLIAPPFMDWLMKCLYGVKFDVNMPDYLKEYIEKICADNQVKYPKIGYINDGTPNAFTYGRTKNDARIVLTQGIFDLLSPDEVKAVVSHEIGHVVHYDMFLMTAIQIAPLLLYYIYEAAMEATNDDDDDNNYTAMIGFVAYLLYIITEYVILWFSRIREYYADEFSVLSTGNPNSLASALVKIGYGLTTAKNKINYNEDSQNEPSKTIKNKHVSSVSALGIFDSNTSKSLVVSSYDDGEISKENIKKSARWELWNPWAKWYEFNSTHPMISNRIKRICKYCKSYNQQPFIEFDEKRPESYVDDFILELFINFLPVITFLVLAIIFLSIVVKVSYSSGEFPDMNMFFGIVIILMTISMAIPFTRSHKNGNYDSKTILELLSEVKVSGVTSIPCTIKGEIIGKGTPGFILSEDFVIKDETGIIFLDYNQPLNLINKLFALLKSKKYINKNVEVKGWYRRCPVPYIEIHTITVDGKVNKCYKYEFVTGFLFVLFVIGVVILISSLVVV